MLRVVFDAAAKTARGFLNEHTMVVPKLLTNLTDLFKNSGA